MNSKRCIEGEVRFDAVSRALYSTDASVYQIHPLGVVVPQTPRGHSARARNLPAPALFHHDARRRDLAGRPGDRQRHSDRRFEILQPGAGGECRGAMGARRARHRARRAERSTAAAGHAVRARHLHRQPRHHRRHDGQQLQRRAQRALRQDHRPRAGAGGGAVRRQRRPLPRDAAQRCARRATRWKPPATGRCCVSRASTRTRSSAAIRRSCGASAATTWTNSPRPRSP